MGAVGLFRAGAAALAVALVIGVAPAHTAAADPASDYSSFFEDDVLRGSGWSSCSGPVTWSVDTGGLTAAAAEREVRRLGRALALWSRHSGVALEFVGREDLVYDNDSFLLRSNSDPTPRTRHIYIGFYGARAVSGLGGSVVGLARPTSVFTAERELVSGMAVFRRGYVTREAAAEPRHLMHLYLHELGHIFGLGHATSPTNVMYPTLGTLTHLGPGDVAGVRAHTRECAVPSR